MKGEQTVQESWMPAFQALALSWPRVDYLIAVRKANYVLHDRKANGAVAPFAFAQTAQTLGGAVRRVRGISAASKQARSRQTDRQVK